MKIYRMIPKKINFLGNINEVKIEEYEGKEIDVSNIKIQYYKIGSIYYVIDSNLGLPIFRFKGTLKNLKNRINQEIPSYIERISKDIETIVAIHNTYKRAVKEYEIKKANRNNNYNPLKELAKKGSGFENGKQRIFNALQKIDNMNEKVDFVKKEYGLGGFSYPRNGNKFQLHSANWFNGKINLRWYVPNQDDDEQEIFTFNQLTREIESLIEKGEYI